MASLLQCFKKSPEYTEAPTAETNQELEEVLTEADIKEIVNTAYKILFLTIKFKDDAKNQIALQILLKKLSSNQEKLKYILHFYVSTFQITDKDGKKEPVEINDSVLGHVLEMYKADVGKIFVDNITDKEIYMYRGYKDPKTKKLLGFCPLICAALNESSEMINLLIKSNVITGKNVDTKDVYGNTLLHFACRRAPVESVKSLLKQGANYKSTNENNRLPIHDAAGSGNVEKIKEIFNRYAKDDIEKKYRVLIDNKIKELKHLYVEKYINERNAKGNLQGKNILEVGKPFQEENDEILFTKGWDNKFEEEAKLRVQHDLQKKFGEDCLKERDVHGNVAIVLAARYFYKFNKDKNRFDAIKWILDNQMEADATAEAEGSNTMLHFISATANPAELQISLKANSLLGAKNDVGIAPLDWIDPDTMRQILDNNLRKEEIKPGKIFTEGKDKYKIIFENTFGHARCSDVKNILALAQSERHEELSYHPLCQSILSIKWQKMKKYFYLKLLFFIPLVIMLSFYPIIVLNYSTAINETKTKLEIVVLNTWYTIYALLLIQVIFGTISILVLIPPFWKETKPFLINFNMRRFYRLLEFYWEQLVWSAWYEFVLWVVAFLHLYGIVSTTLLLLISWLSLLLLCSNHPMLLPYRYVVVIYLQRLVKFIALAVFLINIFTMFVYTKFYYFIKEDNAVCAEGNVTTIYIYSLLLIPFTKITGEKACGQLVDIVIGALSFLLTSVLFNAMNALAINRAQILLQKAHIFKAIGECRMIIEFEVLLNELSSWIAWFNLPHISFLSPLLIERIKASPNSGFCETFEEVCFEEIEKQNDPHSVFLFSTKKGKNWQGKDRGYVLDHKLITTSDALILKAEQSLEHLADEHIDAFIKCIKYRNKAADIRLKYSDEHDVENKYSYLTHDDEEETDDNSDEDEPTCPVISATGELIETSTL